MNQAIKTILTTVIAAAVIGLAANTIQVNSRLASIEAQLRFISAVQTQNLAHR